LNDIRINRLFIIIVHSEVFQSQKLTKSMEIALYKFHIFVTLERFKKSQTAESVHKMNLIIKSENPQKTTCTKIFFSRIILILLDFFFLYQWGICILLPILKEILKK